MIRIALEFVSQKVEVEKNKKNKIVRKIFIN